MVWLSIKAFFLKAWAWCKKYWQLLVGASIPLVIWILMRGRTERLKEALAKIRESHEREVNAIEASKKEQLEALRREAEDKERAAAEMLLKIREIEEKYNVNRSDLDSKKKKELEKLLLDGDSAEVSRRLAEIFDVELEP